MHSIVSGAAAAPAVSPLLPRQPLACCRGDASDVEPPAAEAEGEQIPGGEDEAGDGEGGIVRRGGEEVGGVPRAAAHHQAAWPAPATPLFAEELDPASGNCNHDAGPAAGVESPASAQRCHLGRPRSVLRGRLLCR